MDSSDVDAPGTGVLSGPEASRRVVLGGIQRTGGFLLINLITGLGAVLLLRYLGVADFGRYGTVMALMTIVQGVTDGGLSMTGSRELALLAAAHERHTLLGHLISLRLVLAAIGVLLAITFTLVVGYSSTMVVGTVVVGGSVVLLSVQSGWLLPLVVGLDNWRLAVNDVLRQLILVGGFVVLILAGASLLPFFAASLAAAIIVLLLTPALLRDERPARPRWRQAEMRALAGRALPLAVSGALSVIYFRVLVILMSVLQPSASQLGFYVTSSRVIEIFLSLPIMLVSVVLPVLSVSARDNDDRLQYVTLRMSQVMTTLGAFVALVLATGAPALLTIIGGSQYVGAAPILQIQCIALVTVFLTSAWSTPLVSMGRTRDLTIAGGIGVAAVAGSGTILILAFGAQGAAAAAVVADVVFCAAIFTFLRRAGGGRAITPGPFLAIGVCAAPGVVLAITKPLPSTIDCGIAAVTFVALALWLRILPDEILHRLPLLGRGVRGG